MIIEKDIDVTLNQTDALCHSCNCQHIMGGGVALRIKQIYPEAYSADLATKRGDIKKLGTYSVAQSKKSGKFIYNIYGQYSLGMGIRQTNYEAIYTGLEAVKNNMLATGLKSISVPKRFASTLGGADWRIIEKMIEVVFENSGLDVFICNYQPS